MGDVNADFSGYATKAGLECSDGRTIMPGAFKHMDKMTVPLVWQHAHNEPTNVLGHAVLESRSDGVYAYGYFNDTSAGKAAKQLVQHGDITMLSIYANKLKERASQVFHGMIREVSLVLSGANPGAKIDQVSIAHGDGFVQDLEDEAIIYTGLTLEHSGTADDVDEDDEDDSDLEHADEDLTVQDVYDAMTEEEQTVVNYMIAVAVDQATKKNSAAHSDTDAGLTHQEGNTEVHNIFERNGGTQTEDRHTLSHDDVKGIVADAVRNGSLKGAVEKYALAHGIDNIGTLFPDAKALSNTPEFDKRRTEWVASVLNGVRHSPFSRIKTITADLTQEEARAKGYVKGAYKIEEWIGVTKRTTSPTTIYKKQQLDRDDVLDITDFDVVAWLKAEMRLMLEEEIASAILVGDGRSPGAEDKIKDPLGAADGQGIRSILNEHELFKTEISVNVGDTNSNYEEVVDAVIDGMEYYKGTGTPVFYTTIRHLNMFLKAKDGEGRRYYKNKAEVAEALGVREVVTVDTFSRISDLIGIIVNLDDYNIGADKGGEVNMFDDFDIDYNRQKYLMETRISGALTRIKSALVLRSTTAASALLVEPADPTFNKATGVVTIPTPTNYVYKNSDTGATLTPGAQSALAVGATLNVQAVPNANFHFANDGESFWSFFRRA
jgi:HK97 family phage prohead protease